MKQFNYRGPLLQHDFYLLQSLSRFYAGPMAMDLGLHFFFRFRSAVNTSQQQLLLSLLPVTVLP